MKKIQNFSLCLLAVILIITLLSSCHHNYYAPNSQNVPLFQKKYEARLSAVKSEGEYFRGYEFQGAVSITNNIGIIGNAFIVNPNTDKTDFNWGQGQLIELGAGYFKHVSEVAVVEVYAGGGFGEQKHSYEQGIGSSLKLNRFFLQPAIGYTLKSFDVAFSTRFCALNFNSIKYDNNVSMYVREDLDYIANNKLFFLIEPALTIRAGWKYVKLQGQCVLSRNESNPLFPQANTNINGGIYFVITDKYLKRK